MIDLLEIGLSVVDWIGLAQDRYRWRSLVNSFRVNILGLIIDVLNGPHYSPRIEITATFCKRIFGPTGL
jgi:hypothetical protein